MGKAQAFDLVTHRRDSKTGRIIEVRPYTMKVSKEEGKRYIRDGVIYAENGDVIGKVQQTTSSTKKA